MTQREIGIVIVTYNSEEHIDDCLTAVSRNGVETVVVDNASSDCTRERVAKHDVRLIANSKNAGFAAAANQGIGALSTPFVLLLNPDAVLQKGLEKLRRCCEREEAGAAGGKLVDGAGKPQAGFMVRRFPSPWALIFEALLLNRIWPHNPVNWTYRCYDLDPEKEIEVDQPAGAFLMLRRDVWEQLGGFDEGFCPLWFEDVDFCRRAKAAGYHIWYTPLAVAKHTGGHSLSGVLVEIRALYWYRSFLRYAAKHYRSWEGRMVSVAVLIGSLLRMVAGIVGNRSLKSIAVYGRVIGLAARYLVSGRLDGSRVVISL